jgi:hypothetical protein
MTDAMTAGADPADEPTLRRSMRAPINNNGRTENRPNEERSARQGVPLEPGRHDSSKEHGRQYDAHSGTVHAINFSRTRCG